MGRPFAACRSSCDSSAPLTNRLGPVPHVRGLRMIVSHFFPSTDLPLRVFPVLVEKQIPGIRKSG